MVVESIYDCIKYLRYICKAGDKIWNSFNSFLTNFRNLFKLPFFELFFAAFVWKQLFKLICC